MTAEVYRARAKVEIGTDVTPEVDRKWFVWIFVMGSEVDKEVYSVRKPEICQKV